MSSILANYKGTILVTGTAGGIGSGLVSEILKSQYRTTHHYIYTYHPTAPGNLTEYLLRNASGNHSYELVALDLANLGAIKKFTITLKDRIDSHQIPPLSTFYLLAGGVFTSRSSYDGIDFSVDALEMTFAVNYLANVLLVMNLLQSSKSVLCRSRREESRIIFMSSTTHDPRWISNKYGHWRGYDVLYNKGEEEKVAKGQIEKIEQGGDVFGAAIRRYGTSKLMMNMFM